MPFIGNIGAPELIIIAVIALVIFGPGKLPEVAQSLGRGVREFRKAATDVSESTNLDLPPPSPTPPSAGLPTAAAPSLPSSPAGAPVAMAPREGTPVDPPPGDADQPTA